jgi:hypothetical protein
MVLAATRQWGSAIAEAELAIALDHNSAKADADASFWSMSATARIGLKALRPPFDLS